MLLRRRRGLGSGIVRFLRTVNRPKAIKQKPSPLAMLQAKQKIPSSLFKTNNLGTHFGYLLDTAETKTSKVALLRNLTQQFKAVTDNKIIKDFGNAAYKRSLLHELCPEFLLKYIEALATTDPFLAVKILHSLQHVLDRKSRLGLYLSLDQPRYAEELVKKPYSKSICHSFILSYARRHDSEKVYSWWNKLPYPLMRDAIKMYHIMHLHAIPKDKLLKQFPSLESAPLPFIKASESTVRVVKLVSELMCLPENSSLLHDENVYQLYLDVVTQRSQKFVLSLLDRITSQSKPQSCQIFRELVPQLDIEYAVELVLKMEEAEAYPSPQARDWINILGRLRAFQTPKQVGLILHAIDELRDMDELFTQRAFNAICQANPPHIVYLGQEALEKNFELSGFHCLTMWNALVEDPECPSGFPNQLWQATKRNTLSHGLLRASMGFFLSHNKTSEAAECLHDFVVTQSLIPDARVVDDLRVFAHTGQRKSATARMPRPQRNTSDLKARELLFQELLQKLTSPAVAA